MAKRITVKEAVQELATVTSWETAKMRTVFGQCTVAELKNYVGFIADTAGFKKANWVNAAVAKLAGEKKQKEVEEVIAQMQQARKELAAKLSDTDLSTLSWNEIRDYAMILGVGYTKRMKKVELIERMEEKIREINNEVTIDQAVAAVANGEFEEVFTRCSVKTLREVAEITECEINNDMQKSELIASMVRQLNARKPHTVEEFKAAYDEMSRARGIPFVRIFELRKKLGWSYEEFDDMIKKVRDTEIAQLCTGDVSILTDEERAAGAVKDCFYDENGFRFGTIIFAA